MTHGRKGSKIPKHLPKPKWAPFAGLKIGCYFRHSKSHTTYWVKAGEYSAHSPNGQLKTPMRPTDSVWIDG